jgi:hypothetical protein
VLDGQFGAKTVRDLFHYESEWSLPSLEDVIEISNIMRAISAETQ